MLKSAMSERCIADYKRAAQLEPFIQTRCLDHRTTRNISYRIRYRFIPAEVRQVAVEDRCHAKTSTGNACRAKLDDATKLDCTAYEGG